VAQLSPSERFVLEALAGAPQHLIELSWLGRDEQSPAEAARVVLGLARKGFIEVWQCYEGDPLSRQLDRDEAMEVLAAERHYVPSRSTSWYEADATEEGLVALWGKSDRPYRSTGRLP
jgi:hypothetical protein